MLELNFPIPLNELPQDKIEQLLWGRFSKFGTKLYKLLSRFPGFGQKLYKLLSRFPVLGQIPNIAVVSFGREELVAELGNRMKCLRAMKDIGDSGDSECYKTCPLVEIVLLDQSNQKVFYFPCEVIAEHYAFKITGPNNSAQGLLLIGAVSSENADLPFDDCEEEFLRECLSFTKTEMDELCEEAIGLAQILSSEKDINTVSINAAIEENTRKLSAFDTELEAIEAANAILILTNLTRSEDNRKYEAQVDKLMTEALNSTDLETRLM